MKLFFFSLLCLFSFTQATSQVKVYTENYEQAGQYIINSLNESKLLFVRTGLDLDSNLGGQIVEMNTNLSFEKVFDIPGLLFQGRGDVFNISTHVNDQCKFLYVSNIQNNESNDMMIYSCSINKNFSELNIHDSLRLTSFQLIEEPKVLENDNELIYYFSVVSDELGIKSIRLILDQLDLKFTLSEEVDFINLPVSSTRGPEFLDSIGTELYFSDSRPLYQIRNDTVVDYYYFSWLVQGSYIKSLRNIDLYKSGNDLIVCGPTNQENGEEHFGIGHIYFDELVPTNLENEVSMLWESGEESWNGFHNSLFHNESGDVWAVGSSTDIRYFQPGVNNDSNTNIYAVKLSEDLRDTALVKVIEMEGHAFAWNGHVDDTGDFYITGIYNDYQVDDRNKAFIIKVTSDGIVSTKSIDPEFGAVDIYPNPAMDVLRLFGADDSYYSIIDPLGRIIKSGSVMSDNEYLDITHLTSGKYFLQLERGALRQTIKFVKVE